MRGGYVWVLHGFHLNVKMEGHTKYTSWHSCIITVHVDRLSTKRFCMTNGWQGEASDHR